MIARAVAEAAFADAVRACDPAARVRAALAGAAIATRLAGRARFGIAIGKAGLAMARGAGPVEQGVAITPADDDAPLPAGWTRMVSAHPVPDERSLAAADAAWGIARLASPRDALLVLVSGGASALIEAPRGDLSLDELRAVTGAVMAAGAPIAELNTVRAALSQIKAGGLALESRAPVTTLAISDVVDDDPAVIGSGPTIGAWLAHAESAPASASAPVSVPASASASASASPSALVSGSASDSAAVAVSVPASASASVPASVSASASASASAPVSGAASASGPGSASASAPAPAPAPSASRQMLRGCGEGVDVGAADAALRARARELLSHYGVTGTARVASILEAPARSLVVQRDDAAWLISPMSAFAEAAHDALEARGVLGMFAATPITHTVEGACNELAASFGVIVAWGEPTLVVPEHHGEGGRAQHLALMLAHRLRGSQRSAFIVGSDGADGPPPHARPTPAGAFVDGDTWDAIARAGVDPHRALVRCDAGTALSAVGALVVTGPTGVNHADLVIVG